MPIVLVTFGVAFFLDWISKEWARGYLTVGQPASFLPGFLSLQLTTNSGAAFSIGNDNAPLMTAVAATMTILILGYAIRREKKRHPNEPGLVWVERVAYGLMLGASCGNLLDRLLRGQVTDFLQFQFISFPVFNVADSLICVAVGLLLINSFLGHKK